MTFQQVRRTKLLNKILLSDPFPGEARVMRKRQSVLRFNKTNFENNPEKYMTSEVMLYRPVTGEIDNDNVKQLYDEKYGSKIKVDIVKSQVMKHLEVVEEARYYVEQMKKEIYLTDVRIKLDARAQQNNADY